MKNFSRHEGFTLVELLIVIIVIGVLATMMMLSSTESVSSAKATTIISNLTNLKRATLAWYLDNRDKVDVTGNSDNLGRVTINGRTRPIQEFTDKDLGISKYFSNHVNITFNQNLGTKGSKNNTILKPGCYGIYDAGDPRTIWFVGYAFAEGEDKVRDKVEGRAKALGLTFTDEADPYDTIKRDNDNKDKPEILQRLNGRHAVWLHVLTM